jgi:hypothetical protein
MLAFLAVAVNDILVGADRWLYMKMRSYRFEHRMLTGHTAGHLNSAFVRGLVPVLGRIGLARPDDTASGTPTADRIMQVSKAIFAGVGSFVGACNATASAFSRRRRNIEKRFQNTKRGA